ncbi:MAG: UMP kinase [Candidatus Nealsonbacteria bacterium]
MNRIKKTVIISLGGSIIVPDEINILFLKKFKKFVLKFLKQGYTFVIVTGGGKICRNYQKAAAQISQLTSEDKDWLGIHSTRLNAHLLRTIFKKQAYPTVLDSPYKEIKKTHHKLFIASGWRPGFSTDYNAVILAQMFKVNKIINASNITHVYNKKKKNLTKISWRDYRRLISPKWTPGMNTPFDPIAAKTAQKNGLSVIVANGIDLDNLRSIIQEKEFKGTIIHP